MSVKAPNVDIVFHQYAVSAVARSQRGIAVLIMRDNTKPAQLHTYTQLADVIEADYTAANLQYIKDAFTFSPYRVYVCRIGTEDAVTVGTAIIERNLSTGWVTVCDGTSEDLTALVSWIGSMENARKSYKAIVYKANTPDKKHIVNFCTETVTFADERSAQTGDKYLPSLAGILASCNILRSPTYTVCSNLKDVSSMTDDAIQTALSEGKLIFKSGTDGVKIIAGINSLTTTNGSTATEDMKYIETVEAMDIISDDIRRVFLEEYAGAYRNSYDNQVLLISAINGYLQQLANENVLDKEYDNHVEVNVPAQRAAWIASGKTEAAEWEDTKVKTMTFKRTVFLAGYIKILGSMEQLSFDISME